MSPALMVAGANALALPGCIESSGLVAERLHQYDRTERPWDTALVHHVGYAAHYDADADHSSWPLAATADCAELARYAHEMGIARRHPRQGDILLLWSERESQFVSSGIVVGVVPSVGAGRTSFECTTVEGCVTTDAGSTAPAVSVVHRRISVGDGHCFIRWSHLDGMDRVPHPVPPAEVCVGRIVCVR